MSRFPAHFLAAIWGELSVKDAEGIVWQFSNAWRTDRDPTPNIDLIIDMFAGQGEWRMKRCS